MLLQIAGIPHWVVLIFITMTTQFTPISTIVPKEITIDNEWKGFEPLVMASFSYYDGTRYATHKKLRQTTDFKKVFEKTHFIVCCGDVMIRINHNDFPGIPRRVI